MLLLLLSIVQTAWQLPQKRALADAQCRMQCSTDLKCQQVTVAQVSAVCQAPLPACILVAPAVALPGAEGMTPSDMLLGSILGSSRSLLLM